MLPAARAHCPELPESPQAWGDVGSSVGGVINDTAAPTPAEEAALAAPSATAEAMEVTVHVSLSTSVVSQASVSGVLSL